MLCTSSNSDNPLTVCHFQLYYTSECLLVYCTLCTKQCVLLARHFIHIICTVLSVMHRQRGHLTWKAAWLFNCGVCNSIFSYGKTGALVLACASGSGICRAVGLQIQNYIILCNLRLYCNSNAMKTEAIMATACSCQWRFGQRVCPSLLCIHTVNALRYRTVTGKVMLKVSNYERVVRSSTFELDCVFALLACALHSYEC